jgi:hypothetical protein
LRGRSKRIEQYDLHPTAIWLAAVPSHLPHDEQQRYDHSEGRQKRGHLAQIDIEFHGAIPSNVRRPTMTAVTIMRTEHPTQAHACAFPLAKSSTPIMRNPPAENENKATAIRPLSATVRGELVIVEAP